MAANLVKEKLPTSRTQDVELREIARVSHGATESRIQMLITKLENKEELINKDQQPAAAVINTTAEAFELELLYFEIYLNQQLELRGHTNYLKSSSSTSNTIRQLTKVINGIRIKYADNYAGPQWDSIYHLIKPSFAPDDEIVYYKEKIFVWLCMKSLHRNFSDLPSSFKLLNAESQSAIQKSRLLCLTDWMHWREHQSIPGGIIVMNENNYEKTFVAVLKSFKYQREFLDIRNAAANFEVPMKITDYKSFDGNDNEKLQSTRAAVGSKKADQVPFLDDSSHSESDDEFFTPRSSAHQMNAQTTNASTQASVKNDESKATLSAAKRSHEKFTRMRSITFKFRAGTLILCDANKIKQWENETIGKLQCVALTDGLPCDWDLRTICSYDCIITTFENISNDYFDWGKFFKAAWYRIIIDEPITICKSPKIWLTVCLLKCYGRFIITNVPIEAIKDEIYELFRFLRWPALHFNEIWTVFLNGNEEFREQLNKVMAPVVFNINDYSKS